MNDFTKEELEELMASRCYHLDDSFPADDKIFIKIQSMIDNYCEHNNDPRFNAMPCAGAPKLCTKCHGFYL